MAYNDHVEIETEDQANKWMDELTAKVREARVAVNVFVPDPASMEAQEQRSLYRKLMIHYGVATGALEALVHCRKIGPRAYEEHRRNLLQTMAPSVVGHAGGQL